jgi:hypothetical protein
MNRFAFRRILPIVQLVLWMILEISQRFPTERFDWATAWRVFGNVNWPAARLAMTVNYHLRSVLQILADLPGFFYLLLGSSLILQWYAVGLWLDRRLGLSHRRELSWPSWVRHGIAWASLAVALASSVVSYEAYLKSHPKGRHLDLSMLCWSALAAIASLVEVYSAYRRRNSGPSQNLGPAT